MSRRWLIALVIAGGCGRLGFDPVEDPADAIAIVDIRPAWALPDGGPIDVTLSGNQDGVTLAIDGVTCGSPDPTSPDVTHCIAPAHAPAIVEVTATNAHGATGKYPRFVYLTPGMAQLGGPLNDISSGIAIDREGSIYLSGGTLSDLDGPNAGDFDAVLVKYDASGALAWVRQLGTPQYDYARDVAVDPSGDITIVGYGLGDLDGDGVAAVGNDIFVARYSPLGDLRWVTQTGTPGDDQAWDLAVDDAGEVVVAARTTAAFPGVINAGGLDYVVLRFGNDGSLRWARQVGTPADDYGHSVTVTPDGTAFVVGYTLGALEPARASAGGMDMFVARYERDGTRAWIRQRGTSGDDQAFDVTVDHAENVWIAGTTTGALDGNPNAGGQDAFAMRFDASGTWGLTRVHGSTARENTYGIAVAGDGTVYLSCQTTGAFDGQTNAGGDDLCVVAMAADGTHLWTRIVGTAGLEQASSIAVDAWRTGLIYLSLVTDGSLDGMPSRGGTDLGVAKFDPGGTLR